MELGMIGLGRMGANMAERLVRGDHTVIGYDRDAAAVARAVERGAAGAASPRDLLRRLSAPRAVWLMVPAGAVDATIEQLVPLLAAGDVVIDGGNSNYRDSQRRAAALAAGGLHLVDAGTSGGIWGLAEGYGLMVGGDDAVVQRLRPIFETLAPAPDRGWGHVGPSGAGHFVKMIHNGIEYGLMAAYAEGLNILRRANAGTAAGTIDAETAPLRVPEHFQYDFDLAEITELWRRGSVISSWLLDLTAAALAKDPALDAFAGTVADSGEGRWTLQAAIDEGVPAHVLTAALFERFGSRGHDEFQNKVLSAMRFGFGGHKEQK